MEGYFRDVRTGNECANGYCSAKFNIPDVPCIAEVNIIKGHATKAEDIAFNTATQTMVDKSAVSTPNTNMTTPQRKKYYTKKFNNNKTNSNMFHIGTLSS